MKDHIIAKVVNDLRDTAIKFHATGQLRERMRAAIEPILQDIAPSVAAGSVDTEALRKLAQAATRGPWRHTRQGVIVAGPFRQYTNGAAQSQIASFCVTSHEEDDEHQTEKQVPNALFSAAACPDVVLALIERAEFAQKQWDNWVASANEWKERAEKAEAERDTLKESLRLVNEDHGLWMTRTHAAEDARDDAVARVKELEGEMNRTAAGDTYFDLLPNSIVTI